MSQNRETAVILNDIKQYIFKDTITKFGFDFKIPEPCLYMIEYRADLIRSLYRRFKKAKKLSLIVNLVYHTKTGNVWIAILVIRIAIRNHTNLETFIHYRMPDYYKAFIIF